MGVDPGGGRADEDRRPGFGKLPRRVRPDVCSKAVAPRGLFAVGLGMSGSPFAKARVFPAGRGRSVATPCWSTTTIRAQRTRRAAQNGEFVRGVVARAKRLMDPPAIRRLHS